MKKIFFLMIVALSMQPINAQINNWNLNQMNWFTSIKSEQKLTKYDSFKTLFQFKLQNETNFEKEVLLESESKNEEPPDWVVFILFIFLAIVIFGTGALMTAYSDTFGY